MNNNIAYSRPDIHFLGLISWDWEVVYDSKNMCLLNIISTLYEFKALEHQKHKFWIIILIVIGLPVFWSNLGTYWFLKVNYKLPISVAYILNLPPKK